MEQQIRYCTTSDGVRIAYASAGVGPPVVFSPVFPTHLELDWADPGWQRVFGSLPRNLVVRYDERGSGLSDRTPSDVSLEGLLQDLEAVVDAAGLERFALVGLCQSSPAAIRYAVRHPDRVSRLALYAGYAWQKPSERRARIVAALCELIRSDWQAGAAALAATVMRGRTAEETARYLDLLLRGDAEATARGLELSNTIDIRAELGSVRVPTLVLHRRDDQLVRLESASVIAAGIPGAQLAQLSGQAHFPQYGDTDELTGALCTFLAEGDPEAAVAVAADNPVPGLARIVSMTLSAREAEVLELLALGRTNQQIADELVISASTVARHVSHIFAKTGALNRTEAARFAGRWRAGA